VEFSLAGIIENKPSVYIVDFRGEGLSSRAVIRRGSIVALQKLTLTGVEIRFYQEDSTPIEELYVWCNNKRIHVKDKHIIPYTSARQSVRLVAIKDDFAELINVTVPAEEYKLNVSYVYHEENFLVGSKAKVILQARLFNLHSPITLKALKESRISVSIINHQNISSNFDVSPVEWDHRNEYVLEIPIQAYLKSIDIAVTGKVGTYEGKLTELNSNETIRFRDADERFVELFLRRDGEEYKIQLLGNNGEPKPAINLQVYISSSYYNNRMKKELTTN